MKTYKAYVSWTMSAVLEVQADSLEDAIAQVNDDDSLPPDNICEYVDGSFRVNEECTAELNGVLGEEE